MVRVVGMNSRRGAPMDMDIAAAVWMTSRINSAEDSSVMRTVGTEQPMVATRLPV